MMHGEQHEQLFRHWPQAKAIWEGRDERLKASLPRSETMAGDDLRIVETDGGTVTVTDGERTAVYAPLKGDPLQGPIEISPAYVEAGWFSEANCVTLTNGDRRAVYVPVRVL